MSRSWCHGLGRGPTEVGQVLVIVPGDIAHELVHRPPAPEGMDPAAGPLIGGEVRDPPQQGGPRLRESVRQLSEAQSLAGPDHGRGGGPSSSSDSSALCVRRSSAPRWKRMATTGAIRRRSTADRQDQHGRAHIRWAWPQASPAGRGSAPAAGNRHLEPARRPGDRRRSPGRHPEPRPSPGIRTNARRGDGHWPTVGARERSERNSATASWGRPLEAGAHPGMLGGGPNLLGQGGGPKRPGLAVAAFVLKAAGN